MSVLPFDQAPRWAVLQRELFDLLDSGWRRFEELYCAPDGSLVYNGQTFGRDGVDDFYEPFFNWPMLYLLGGADDLLAASKAHWRGVTAQLTARGLVTDEYESGYDWFHQGESLLFFYGICAADPDDEEFKQRALRFADLFLPGSPTGNYDGLLRMMRAPHNGALGPRPGLGEDRPFSADNLGMRRYGLPLSDVPGIASWDDLTGDRAQLMADEMDRRLGVGDIPLNLAVTSLLTNAWLYDHDERYAEMVESYTGAWLERASANGGLIPDNVGPHGEVGELHGGRWYGGHYGWFWPHGLHSVIAPALIAAINATVVAGRNTDLELPRAALAEVLRQARAQRLDPADCTFIDAWLERLGSYGEKDLLVVPYRRREDGWFDHQPLPPSFPAWLWWAGRDPADQRTLADLADRSGYPWKDVHDFRSKEEAGHEPPWLEFLAGRNPDYPETALAMAIEQARRQMDLMEQHPTPPPGDDIHWWQGLNPVVTEILTQMIAGAPQVLYNGGLPYAQIRWTDAERDRPGLPQGVAALVDFLGETEVGVRVANLDSVVHTVRLTGGGYGEHPFDEPVELTLPPGTETRLRLPFTRLGRPARHQRSPHSSTGA